MKRLLKIKTIKSWRNYSSEYFTFYVTDDGRMKIIFWNMGKYNFIFFLFVSLVSPCKRNAALMFSKF